MRITIDTKHDSREDIRKAIELLRSVSEQGASSPEMFSNPGGYQDIFGNSSPQPSQPQQPQPSGLFDMFSTPSQDSSYPQQPSTPAYEKPKPKRPAFLGFELYE